MTVSRRWMAGALIAALALGGCASLRGDRDTSLAAGGGWYDGFYYPGKGMHVYDSWGRGRPWTPRERAYWARRKAS